MLLLLSCFFRLRLDDALVLDYLVERKVLQFFFSCMFYCCNCCSFGCFFFCGSATLSCWTKLEVASRRWMECCCCCCCFFFPAFFPAAFLLAAWLPARTRTTLFIAAFFVLHFTTLLTVRKKKKDVNDLAMSIVTNRYDSQKARCI